MKSIRKIFFTGMAVILGTSLFLSCSKEENAHADNAKGAITVSIDGELGALAQIDDTKSSLSNPIRLSWEGAEKVYAFDGVKCLGALDVTLKDGKDYYALLSGELDAPAEGTTVITLVHAPGFTATKGEAITDGKLSFDLSSQSGAVATAPFVAYASMEYEEDKISFDKLVVNFTFATSIIRINCSGMEASKSFTTTVSGMSNECVLQINGNGASVGTGATGNISLASANTNAQGTKMLYAGLARTASRTDVSVVATQGNKSYEGAIVNGSAWAAKTAYNTICPLNVTSYIVINGLKWAKQNLAISESGNKSWKGDNSSAVKVPGTDEDVIPGDHFQWAAYEGYCQVEGQTVADRGLLIYESFTSKECGDGSKEYVFKLPGTLYYWFKAKDGADRIGISAYYDKTTSTYTMYTDEAHATLDRTGGYTGHNDDVASIVLGGSWRVPTIDDFTAMRQATYWAWDSNDKGCYVFIPGQGTSGSAGGRGTIAGTDDKTKAALFFPAAGEGIQTQRTEGSYGYYWSSSLSSSDMTKAHDVSFSQSNVSLTKFGQRDYGLSVRPVSDFNLIIPVL